jgi:HD-like signal output (HDOD) protein
MLREEYKGPVGALVDLIGSDLAMTASILKVANSALFGGLGSVTDLRMAIARLGVREVTAIITMLAHRAHFKSNDPARQKHLRALWDHAIVTGLGTRRLAAISRVETGDAFLAGLLHDTGKLVLLLAFDQIEHRPGAVPMSSSVRVELMQTLHAELGHKVLHDWLIPEPVCRVALSHHEPAADGDRLMTCVRAANAMSRKIGAHPEPRTDLSLVDLPEFEQMNLGDLEIATLMVDVEEDLAQLRALI